MPKVNLHSFVTKKASSRASAPAVFSAPAPARAPSPTSQDMSSRWDPHRLTIMLPYVMWSFANAAEDLFTFIKIHCLTGYKVGDYKFKIAEDGSHLEVIITDRDAISDASFHQQILSGMGDTDIHLVAFARAVNSLKESSQHNTTNEVERRMCLPFMQPVDPVFHQRPSFFQDPDDGTQVILVGFVKRKDQLIKIGSTGFKTVNRIRGSRGDASGAHNFRGGNPGGGTNNAFGGRAGGLGGGGGGGGGGSYSAAGGGFPSDFSLSTTIATFPTDSVQQIETPKIENNKKNSQLKTLKLRKQLQLLLYHFLFQTKKK